MDAEPLRRPVLAVLLGTLGVFLLNLGYMGVGDAVVSAVKLGLLMALGFVLVVVWRRRRARQTQAHPHR